MTDINTLQQRLDAAANPKTKAWWESYLKGVIPFRGVKMADIRAALHTWVDEEGIGDMLPASEQKDLALALLRETHTEDKLAGILYLQEILLPAGAIDWRVDLPRFAVLFENGHIYDWNTCDWFCVKVLGPLAEREGEACARAIAAWRSAGTLWQRRAGAVAFVNLAAKGEENFPGFTAMLLETCGALAESDERFAQTGAGWVLRELSVAAPARVTDCIETNLHQFSSEGLRYAIAKLPDDTQSRLKAAHKATRAGL